MNVENNKDLSDIAWVHGWSWEHPGYWECWAKDIRYSLGNANGPIQCEIYRLQPDSTEEHEATIELRDKVAARSFMCGVWLPKPKPKPHVVALIAYQLGTMRAAVNGLLDIYEANPELNDVQPQSFQDTLPMSIDEWAVQLGTVIDDWLKLI